MVEQIKTFFCSYCGKNKSLAFLGGITDERGSIDDIKTTLDEKIRQRSSLTIATTLEQDYEKLQELAKVRKEIEHLQEQIHSSKKAICRLC